MMVDYLHNLGIFDARRRLAHLVVVDENDLVAFFDVIYELQRLDAVFLENHRAFGRHLSESHWNVFVFGIEPVLQIGECISRHDRVVVRVLVSDHVNLCHWFSFKSVDASDYNAHAAEHIR